MIETKRCRLIGLQETDFEDLKKLYKNHQVRKYLGGTIDDEIILRNMFKEVLKNSNDDYYWVIRSINDNQFCGLVTLSKYHDGLNIEVSYQFLPEWWGSGIAAEVIKTIIKYSFDVLGLTRLVAETQTANIPSCRLLERVGMKLESKLNRFDTEQSLYSIERYISKL